MSRVKSAASIIGAEFEEVAPSITEMKNQNARQKTTETASMARDQNLPEKAKSGPKIAASLRCTLTIPPGTQTEKVLLDLLETLPERTRKRLNYASMFADLIKANDKEVARMLKDVI